MKNLVDLRFGYIAGCRVLVLVFMILAALYINNNRGYNWDLLGYVAVINGYQTSDHTLIHQRTYQQVAERSSADAYRLLTQDVEPDERGPRNSRADMASNAEHFAQMLPFYRIRPIYTGSLWLLTKMGAHPVDAAYWMNMACLPLFIGMLFLWLSRLLPLWKASLLSIVLTLGLQTVGISREAGPDILSAVWLLLGFYFLIQKQQLHWGLLLITLSIGIRTDNILLLFSTLLMLLLYQRLALTVVCTVAAAALVFYLGIHHLSGNYGWWTIFYFTFIYSQNTPADTTPAFSAVIYFKYLAQAIPKALAWYPLFSIYWVVNLLCLAQKKLTLIVMLAWILALSAAAKFVLFPAAWERFYLLHYTLNLLCLIMLWGRQENGNAANFRH